jgi:hypothetical protein
MERNEDNLCDLISVGQVKAFIKQNTGDKLMVNEEGWLCRGKGKDVKNGLITMKIEGR